MKLFIKSIETHAGKDFHPTWYNPMYLVNGRYLASSIDAHNINGGKFDLEVGEVAEVEIEDGKVTENQWIIRKSPNFKSKSS